MMTKTKQHVAPLWAQELSARYRSGIAHAFLIHGNVQDYVGGIAGQSLKNYLLASFAERDIVVYWHRAGGFFFPKAAMKKRFAEVVGLISSQPGTGSRSGGGLAAGMNALAGATGAGADPLAMVDQLGRQPLAALNLLNQLLHASQEQAKSRQPADTPPAPFRVAVVVDYAETIAPATEAAASPEDRTALVTLAEWGRDASIGQREHIVVMIASDLHDLNERLRKSGARWEQIEVAFPSLEERQEFTKMLIENPENQVQLAEGITYEEVARLTTGLRYIDIEDIVLRASFQQQPVTRRLVKTRKDEIVASEFEEVLQVVENESGFEALGGLTEIKEYLMENVVKPMRQGNYRLVPQGILLMGPAGTGKTRLARALAKEAGVTFVELQPSKIFSKWVGDTERRLERALAAIKAMTPCLVFIDEVDQAVGRGESGDSGVSNRVFKRLMEIMSDTTFRGKIVWISASNRPDLLDAALLRPGRLDKKIPILAPDATERASILEVLTIQAFGQETDLPTQQDYQALAEQMEGYTGAEIEGIVGKATQLSAKSRGTWSVAHCLQEAYERIIPSTQDIDTMTRLALLHCNDLDLVPAHLRELARAVRKPAADSDENEARLPQGRRSRRSEL
ncbi:MAG: AAA family ATPase [Ktedonobacteraceae bacterium]